jgi:hypothetical protein
LQDLEHQSDDALVPLSTLQQLTRLQLQSVRRAQLQHLQLPQLQHLQASLYTTYHHKDEPMLLGHMTSLTALDVQVLNRYWPADLLPPNLLTFHLTLRRVCVRLTREMYQAREDCCSSLHPLLQLGSLQQLHLELPCCERTVPAAHELAALSSLGCLQDIRVDWKSEGFSAATADAIAAALEVLPLQALTLPHAGIPADVLQRLGCLQGLTALELSQFSSYGMSSQRSVGNRQQRLDVPAAQLCRAVLLQQLTVLHCLRLSSNTLDDKALFAAASADGHVADARDDHGGVVSLLQAIGRLHHLTAVRVDIDVWLLHVSVQQLDRSRVLQLLSSPLSQSCSAYMYMRPVGTAQHGVDAGVSRCMLHVGDASVCSMA